VKSIITFVWRLLTATAELCKPSGARVLNAENTALRHQLLVMSRSQKCAPNLTSTDRFIFGFCSFYIQHDLQSLFAQRIYQVACAYEDGNDANKLRTDPLFKLSLERKPLDSKADLASAPTFSRLENAASTRDIYRIARAFVDQFIASYARPPKLIVSEVGSDTTFYEWQLIQGKLIKEKLGKLYLTPLVPIIPVG